MASTIVVDAATSVWAVLPQEHAVQTAHLFALWAIQRAQLVAPSLWWAETTAAVRSNVFHKRISYEAGERALADLARLGIQVLSTDAAECRRAYYWSARLNQARAYDGFYLALAERLGAELWTGDLRLARACRQQGLAWVHSASDESP